MGFIFDEGHLALKIIEAYNDQQKSLVWVRKREIWRFGMDLEKRVLMKKLKGSSQSCYHLSLNFCEYLESFYNFGNV